MNKNYGFTDNEMHWLPREEKTDWGKEITTFMVMLFAIGLMGLFVYLLGSLVIL